eukprot:TRINITY_DN1763_c0_g1_i2.p1 TRINITY_DN1763_c0_g1~~TRINITY_DN1763_c0_g1_i2.p1  ORF type:complete len:327 (+),score=-5.64 TRINITY_DN1763_c0_g1_i2:259-1239(+)
MEETDFGGRQAPEEVVHKAHQVRERRDRGLLAIFVGPHWSGKRHIVYHLRKYLTETAVSREDACSGPVTDDSAPAYVVREGIHIDRGVAIAELVLASAQENSEDIARIQDFLRLATRGKYDWTEADQYIVLGTNTDVVLDEPVPRLKPNPSTDIIAVIVPLKGYGNESEETINRKIGLWIKAIRCWPMFKVVFTKLEELITELYGDQRHMLSLLADLVSEQSLHRLWILGILKEKGFTELSNILDKLARDIGRPKCFVSYIPSESTAATEHAVSDLLLFMWREVRDTPVYNDEPALVSYTRPRPSGSLGLQDHPESLQVVPDCPNP